MLSIIYCSLAIIFISSCFEEGMIFGGIGDWVDTVAPEIAKPLFGCVICMSPWYGTAYWVVFNVEMNPIQFILSVGGLNVLISLIYGRFSD